MITPLDIQNKEFSKGVRGYKEDEVDGFLDLITLDYDKVMKENRDLKERVRELDNEIEHLKSSEGSIFETLEKARELMNEIAASAEKRADMVLKNAELDARRIRKEAQESVDHLTNDAETLNQRVQLFKEKYRSLLTNELDKMENVTLDFFQENESQRRNAPANQETSTKENL